MALAGAFTAHACIFKAQEYNARYQNAGRISILLLTAEGFESLQHK